MAQEAREGYGRRMLQRSAEDTSASARHVDNGVLAHADAMSSSDLFGVFGVSAV